MVRRYGFYGRNPQREDLLAFIHSRLEHLGQVPTLEECRVRLGWCNVHQVIESLRWAGPECIDDETLRAVIATNVTGRSPHWLKPRRHVKVSAR